MLGEWGGWRVEGLVVVKGSWSISRRMGVRVWESEGERRLTAPPQAALCLTVLPRCLCEELESGGTPGLATQGSRGWGSQEEKEPGESQLRRGRSWQEAEMKWLRWNAGWGRGRQWQEAEA